MAQSWKDEALALREGMAKLAEAFGWSDVRQEDGDLHLPCAEDIIERAKKLNLNDEVWVRLTQKGVDQFVVATEPGEEGEPVAGDLFGSPLWELMALFGPGQYHGGPALFEKQLVYLQYPGANAEPEPKPATLQLLKDEGTDASEPD